MSAIVGRILRRKVPATKLVGMGLAQSGVFWSSRSSNSRAHRNLATSAEKRKWKRHPTISKKEQVLQSLSEEATTSKGEKTNDDTNPFLFLVVFPVVMTGLFVFLRQDLRDELREKAPIRLVKKTARNQIQEESKDEHNIQTPVASKKEQ